LLKQQRLEPLGARAQRPGDLRGGALQRLEAQAAQAATAAQLLAPAKRHAAEAPRVIEAERLLEPREPDLQVQVLGGPLRGALQHQPPGHAQVDQELAAVVEAQEQVLAAPARSGNPPAHQAGREGLAAGLGENAAQQAARTRPGHAPAGEARAEVAQDGLDFGELGHGRLPSGGRRFYRRRRRPVKRGPVGRRSRKMLRVKKRCAFLHCGVSPPEN